MDGSLGHFKATILRRKQRLEKKNGKFDKKNLNYNSNKARNLEFPKPSKKELALLKKSIRNKLKKRKRIEFIIFVFVIIILLLVVLNLF